MALMFKGLTYSVGPKAAHRVPQRLPFNLFVFHSAFILQTTPFSTSLFSLFSELCQGLSQFLRWVIELYFRVSRTLYPYSFYVSPSVWKLQFRFNLNQDLSFVLLGCFFSSASCHVLWCSSSSVCADLLAFSK